MRRGARAAALAAGALLLAGTQPKGTLLDETVAVISSKIPAAKGVSVITRWDIEARARVESVRRYGKEGATRSISGALRQEVFTALVEESLIAMELTRLGFEWLDAARVDEELGKLTAVFGGSAPFFKAMKPSCITEPLLRSWIERSLIVDAWVEAQMVVSPAYKDADPEKRKLEKRYFRVNLVEEIRTKYHVWIYKKLKPS